MTPINLPPNRPRLTDSLIKSRPVILIILITTTLALLCTASLHLGLISLLRKNTKLQFTVSWMDLGPTPFGERGFTPQGMSCANGRILFANTWKNLHSRVYEYDPCNMRQELRFFDMPSPAVHTSGLCWDGECLLAVDYISNRAYCIDLEDSLACHQAKVRGEFDTTLKGTSACCLMEFEGRKVLAISDFMRSKATIFVDYGAALKSGSAAGAIVFQYRNEGFSQGLEYIHGFLFESENKLGRDVINQIDIERLKICRNARQATVRQICGPSSMIEDLAWDGEYLYTSDEGTFRFYRASLPPLPEIR